jgi:hypothetical protein
MSSILSSAILSAGVGEKIILTFTPFHVRFNFICMYEQYCNITIYMTVQGAKRGQKSLFLLILQEIIETNSSWSFETGYLVRKMQRITISSILSIVVGLYEYDVAKVQHKIYVTRSLQQ